MIKLARLLQKLETSTNCNEYDHCLFKSIDNQSRQRHTICMQQIIILIPGSQNLKLVNRCSRWRKPSIRKRNHFVVKYRPLCILHSNIKSLFAAWRKRWTLQKHCHWQWPLKLLFSCFSHLKIKCFLNLCQAPSRVEHQSLKATFSLIKDSLS